MATRSNRKRKYRELASNEDNIFEVETIIKMRRKKDQRQYLIKWPGYPLQEMTWENVENLNCDELLEKFHTWN